MAMMSKSIRFLSEVHICLGFRWYRLRGVLPFVYFLNILSSNIGLVTWTVIKRISVFRTFVLVAASSCVNAVFEVRELAWVNLACNVWFLLVGHYIMIAYFFFNCSILALLLGDSFFAGVDDVCG